MPSGRVSDTTLVAAMLVLVTLAAAGFVGVQWMLNRESKTDAQRALERQPAELVDFPTEFRGNPAGPECEDGTVLAAAIGVDDGEMRWQQELPGISAYGNLLTVVEDGLGGHVALHVDAAGAELPPSVMALDVASGRLLWQRFLEAEWIDRYAVSQTELVLAMAEPAPANQPGEPQTTVAISADGSLSDWFASIGEPWEEQSRQQPGPGYHFAEVQSQYTTMVDDQGRNTTNGQSAQVLVADSLHFGPLVLHDAAEGSSLATSDVPFDEEFNFLGQTSSIGSAVHVDEHHVLAVIGSDFGPNTRLAVFDRRSGEVLWQLDHLRAGALAEGLVIYDKRNEEASDAESTRNIHVVSADDPNTERWSTALSVNQAGGNGFLGTADGNLVFAVEDDELELQFLVIQDERDVPDLIAAAENYGSGVEPWRFHLDSELMAAATADGVVIQHVGRGASEATLVATEYEPNQVQRVDDVLLINQWLCPER